MPGRPCRRRIALRKKFVRLVALGATASTSSTRTTSFTRTPTAPARRTTTTTSSTSPAATEEERPNIGGTFRGSGGSPQEATICPRTGLEVPSGMEIGARWPTCLAWLVAFLYMVLCRRRDGAAFFFGWANFPTARGCKYTLELDEGLALAGRIDPTPTRVRALRVCARQLAVYFHAARAQDGRA